MNKYIVRLTSKPGFYSQYTGNVEVYANNDEEAVDNAFSKLKRGSFPDRDRNMWRVLSVSRNY